MPTKDKSVHPLFQIAIALRILPSSLVLQIYDEGTVLETVRFFYPNIFNPYRHILQNGAQCTLCKDTFLNNLKDNLIKFSLQPSPNP